MQPSIRSRQSLSVWGAGLFLFAASTAIAAVPEHQERHFTVQGHPVVVLQNVVNGRIEVKSWKNPEVVVSSTAAKDKVAIDMEQVGDRIDIAATSTVAAGQPHEVEANFQLTVPERHEAGKHCRRCAPEGSLRVHHREDDRRLFCLLVVLGETGIHFRERECAATAAVVHKRESDDHLRQYSL
jgi:ribosomal protein L31E